MLFPIALPEGASGYNSHSAAVATFGARGGQKMGSNNGLAAGFPDAYHFRANADECRCCYPR
jgi:hypothetical protein